MLLFQENSDGAGATSIAMLFVTAGTLFRDASKDRVGQRVVSRWRSCPFSKMRAKFIRSPLRGLKHLAKIGRPGSRLVRALQFQILLPQLHGFVRGSDIRMIGRGFPAVLLAGTQPLAVLVNGHHGLNNAGRSRHFGKRFPELGKGFCAGRFEFLHTAIQAGVVGRGASLLQKRLCLRWSPSGSRLAHQGCCRRAAMLSMVTVDIDGARQVSGGLRQFDDAVCRHAIIADGQVDIAQAMSPGGFHVRTRAIHADDGLNTLRGEPGKSRIPFRLRTGKQAGCQSKDIMQRRWSVGDQFGRSGGRSRRSPQNQR